MAPQPRPKRAASIDEIERLYRQSYARFLRVAVAARGNTDRGRDAVHEAFVRAIRSLDDFRGEGSLESWVWRTLINVCIDGKRDQPVLFDHVPETAVAYETPEWPELRAAISDLPERQRIALFLRHYADLDYEQIGAVLGISRGTVAATLHAAHKKLGNVLGKVTR